jgi:hypothetical protein
MGYKATNNATSTLAAGISTVATILSVAPAQGDRFPVILAPDFTYLTLENASGNREVVKVIARALGSDLMTISRGLDGTSARAWSAADIVDLRLTALSVTEAFDHLSLPAGAHTASAISLNPVGDVLATDVQSAIAELAAEKATATSVAALIQGMYPIGALYISTLATNPATLLGFGTWSLFGNGRVLVGYDGGAFTNGAIGGSADAVVPSHSHAFTGDALPGHSHTTPLPATWSAGNSGGITFTSGSAVGASGFNGVSNSISAGTPSGTISTTGVSLTNANLQPYIVVYMWRRSA